MQGRLMVFFFGVAACLRASMLPEVPEEAALELGTTSGTPQLNGFVFIEGRYVPPPYTVARKGNGIFVNRIQVSQPIPWSRVEGGGAEPAPPSPPTPPPSPQAPPADGETDGDAVVDPVEEPDGADAAPVPVPVPVPVATPRPVRAPAPARAPSIDDLFADDDEEEEAKTPPARQVAPAVQVAPRKPVKPVETAPLPPISKERLKDGLDKLRLRYETALSRKEIFFFSARHTLISGNSGVARTLIGVLPTALRAATSPDDLLARLQAGGVYFLDLETARMLYRNKLMFPQLQARLDKIKRTEEREMKERERRTREVRGY